MYFEIRTLSLDTLLGTIHFIATLLYVIFASGSIKLLKDENKQWELQVDHNLFALHRLDITVSSDKGGEMIDNLVDP